MKYLSLLILTFCLYSFKSSANNCKKFEDLAATNSSVNGGYAFKTKKAAKQNGKCKKTSRKKFKFNSNSKKESEKIYTCSDCKYGEATNTIKLVYINSDSTSCGELDHKVCPAKPNYSSKWGCLKRNSGKYKVKKVKVEIKNNGQEKIYNFQKDYEVSNFENSTLYDDKSAAKTGSCAKELKGYVCDPDKLKVVKVKYKVIGSGNNTTEEIVDPTLKSKYEGLTIEKKKKSAKKGLCAKGLPGYVCAKKGSKYKVVRVKYKVPSGVAATSNILYSNYAHPHRYD